MKKHIALSLMILSAQSLFSSETGQAGQPNQPENTPKISSRRQKVLDMQRKQAESQPTVTTDTGATQQPDITPVVTTVAHRTPPAPVVSVLQAQQQPVLPLAPVASTAPEEEEPSCW